MDENDAELEARRERCIQDLKKMSEDPACVARLHELEQQILREVLTDNAHIRCAGCLTWMTKLLQKARTE